MRMKRNRRTFAILAIASLIVLCTYIFLQYSIPSNPNERKYFCASDRDCISVCGLCENVTYFHSNPPPRCPIPLNNTGRDSSGRICFCENNLCMNPTNITTNQQSPPSQPMELNGIFSFYVLMGSIVIIIFLVVVALVNFLMKSPTETW